MISNYRKAKAYYFYTRFVRVLPLIIIIFLCGAVVGTGATYMLFVHYLEGYSCYVK